MIGSLAGLRHWAANSSHPIANLIRSVRKRLQRFSLPAPRILIVPYLWLFLFLRGIVFQVRRLLFAEPLFKAYCTKVGRNVTTGIYIPWVRGRGELIVGDNVQISGKLSIIFASRFTARPQLTIGDYTDIAHNVSFVVGREIRIGAHVEIAGGVSFRDSSGHAADPTRRLAGAPPDDEDVKPIIVHDNVWIGAGAILLPGVEIGEGSIIAARAMVSAPVAPYTVVAGSPARRVGVLTPPPGREHLAPAQPTRKSQVDEDKAKQA